MADPSPAVNVKRITRETVAAENLDSILRGRPGLLIGPGLTLGAGSMTQLARCLADGFDGPRDLPLLQTADAIVQKDVDPLSVRGRTRECLGKIPPNRALELIVKTRWSAVLSAALDDYFEDAFQRWCDRSPVRRDVTRVTNYRQPIPPGTIPVFKLLGSGQRDDFVITSNDYRVQQPLWHRPLRDFVQAVQGAPVLCVGMAECTWVLLDVLALMLSEPTMVPGPLLLLEDDVVSRDGQLNDLARRGLRVVNIAMPLGGFITSLAASTKTGHTLKLPFDEEALPPLEQLISFSELAVAVNSHTTSAIGTAEIHRLRDLRFSPTAPHWEPYVHNLDFSRSVTPRLIDRIKAALAAKDEALTEIIVRGASATGKTTVLKRAALDLAAAGALVLWLRPYFYQNGPQQLRRMLEKVSETKAHGDRRFVIFVDDPVSLGTIHLDEIGTSLTSLGMEAVLVVGTRSTDVATADSELSLHVESSIEDIEVPERFDEAEWKALPDYLVRLGVARSIEEARGSTSNAPGRKTRDVLGMLFWLLPETRSRITESVRDEYLRLGDRAAFSQVIVGEFNHTSGFVRDAYALVAVAERFGTPVPMEVLVSALGVSYDEWLRAATRDGLLWGLLYQEASDDGETTIYHTRNDVVTNIIVSLVNGGLLSRAGELSRLGRLLSACNGSSPVYREFCIRILVPPQGSRSQLESLEYAEGLDLFERAINALPFEDRTLHVHQMGRWEKNKGQDPARARATLERALRTPVYPYATKGEAVEHIHTTLAATELDAIKLGQVTPEQGKQSVMLHLERARAGQFFNNPNAVHVQAKLIANLADLTGKPSDPDSVGLIDTALGDVDRTLLLLKSEFVTDPQRRHNVELLEAVRGEVLDRCIAYEQLAEDAERMWKDFRRQDGFALIARRLFGKATATGRGSDFKAAFDFCTQVRARLAEAEEVISHRMAEVTLHVYFRWQVRRRGFSGTDPIDWKLLEQLATHIVGIARSKRDPFYSYILALAKAHLGDWPAADAIFEDLRSRGLPTDVLFEPRDYLMEEKGGLRRVQGIITQGAGKRLLFVEALKRDFLLDRYGKWGREGDIAHAYIQFRFAGPGAVDEP